uniref:Uncharacterized protein n=1 Tax=viral metagenome TaxID=1070528 RepID=A0A6M3KYM1_9ZZZZ
MKIRNGFVSNSSSSSYIIRGVKLNADEVSKIIGEEAIAKEMYPDDYDNTEDCRLSAIENALYHLTRDKIDSHRMNYFYYDQIDNDPNKDKFVIGEEAGELSDGEWGEIPEWDDNRILGKLAKVGINATSGDLKTFAYYLSNDNY